MNDEKVIQIANDINSGKELCSADWKFWVKLPEKLKQGIFDGFNSTRFKNPIHNQWQKDKSGKLKHFNHNYLKGYKLGYKDKSNILPFCF